MAKRRRKRNASDRERRPPAVQPPGLPGKNRRRRFVLLFLAVGVALAVSVLVLLRQTTAAWPRELGRGSAEGFNLLVITLDTTRADHLGCYGHASAQTPVLDELANRGVRFEHAVCTVPLTLPSHATIFTGLYPPNHGVRNNGDHTLATEQVTLAELLLARGYSTGAFVAAFVLDARFGLNQGFELFDDRVDPRRPVDHISGYPHRAGDQVTDSAIAWLASHDVTSPFFAWVHYYDPHAPYRPPPPFDRQFANARYDGEIAFMDMQIGRLLKSLEDLGVRDRTLVVVLADHGESLGEHNEKTHGQLVYDASMKIPLIFNCPAIFSSGVVVDDFTAGTVDVLPTILDLLGMAVPAGLDGVSLVQGPPPDDRALYMETFSTFLNHGWAPLSALRRDADKYILAPRPEYYDLEADANELSNVYNTASVETFLKRDELVADLATRLAGWPSIEGIVASMEQLDADTIRKLEALGYVGVGSGAAADADLDQLADPKDMMHVMRTLDEAAALAAQQRVPEAVRILEDAATKAPRDHHVLFQLASNLLKLNREDDAYAVLTKATNIRPAANALVLLAQIDIKRMNFESAHTYLSQAEAVDAGFGALYLARGDILALMGDPVGAIRQYERGKQVDVYRVGEAADARIIGIKRTMEQHGIVPDG